jgi:hypothetical protein
LAGLTVTPRSGSHFELQWQDRVAGEQKIRVLRRRVGLTWELVGELPANATRFVSVGCLARTSYEHKVVALGEPNLRIESATVSATTLEPLAARRSQCLQANHARQGSGSLIKVNGVLLCFYHLMPRGGTHDKSLVYLGMKSSSDDGKTWSDEIPLFKEKTHSTKHPAAVVMPDGRIALSYSRYENGTLPWKAERGIRYFPKRGATVASTAASIGNPANWSEYDRITDDSLSYQEGLHDRLRVLSDGSLIIPVLASDGAEPHRIGTHIYKLAARDTGNPVGRWRRKTPERLYIGGRSGFVESVIEEWDPQGHPGHLLCLGRTETTWFYEARSTDYGETWSAPVPSSIRAPIAPPYLRRIPETGRLVLIWNPYVYKPKGWKSDDADWALGERRVLASMTSDDGGRTWGHYKQIEHDPDPVWWYVYPFLLFDRQHVHLLYHGWKNGGTSMLDLAYVKLPADWFTSDAEALKR